MPQWSHSQGQQILKCCAAGTVSLVTSATWTGEVVHSCGLLIHEWNSCEAGQLFISAIHEKGTSQSSLEIVLLLSVGEV